MPGGILPRPWTSGSATVVARTLQGEQPKREPLKLSVGTHLDRGQVLVADENELDVLRDIFSISQRDTPTQSFCTFSDETATSLPCWDGLRKKGRLSPPDLMETFPYLLESCGHAKNISEGMSLHHCVVSSGLEKNPSLCDHLARMHGRCGLCNDAFYCFNNMGDRSITMWSFMIGLHLEHKRKGRTVIQLFRQSLNCNVFPDSSTLLILLSSCADQETLARGKQIHVLVKCIASELDVVMGTALLTMYIRCNNLQAAQILFDRIPEKNIVSWNAMIAAFVQHDNGKEAIRLFTQMQQEGIYPNNVTFVSAISACAREREILMGKSIHTQITKMGLELDVTHAAALVCMYGKLGSIEKASMVFKDSNEACVILWTGMLTVYCQHGHVKEALQAFVQMQEHGILPNQVTFLCLISATKAVPAGRRLHAQIVPSGVESNCALSTALTHMYGYCGSMVDAHGVFSSLSEKSTVTWNAMISVCVTMGQSGEGIQLFRRMQQQGVSPDQFTFVNILHACACLLVVFEGKKVHQHVLQTEFRFDIVVCNALVDMYSKFNLLGPAQSVFDGMHERNTVSWNSLMASYTQNGFAERVLILFNQMQLERIMPDAVTFASILASLVHRANLCDCWRIHSLIIQTGFDMELVVATELINVYNKCGSLKDAQLVFERMCARDDILWSAAITAQGQHDSFKAIQLFDQMRNQGFIPSIRTLTTCLSVCANHCALTKIKQLHITIVHSGVELGSEGTGEERRNEGIYSLVNGYSECGDIQRAECLFCLFYSRDLKLWNLMIAGLAGHGEGAQAIEVFKKIQQQKIIPDEATFLHLLSACGHSGLVDEALHFLRLMNTLYNLAAAMSHYDCVVDLMGRVGQLTRAVFLIEKMPYHPTAVTWTSLLGSCRTMLDIQGGESAANHLVEASKEGFVPYILLSRLYGTLDRH